MSAVDDPNFDATFGSGHAVLSVGPLTILQVQFAIVLLAAYVTRPSVVMRVDESRASPLRCAIGATVSVAVTVVVSRTFK